MYLLLLHSSYQLKADTGQQMKHSNKPSQKTNFFYPLCGSFMAEVALQSINPPANPSTQGKQHMERSKACPFCLQLHLSHNYLYTA